MKFKARSIYTENLLKSLGMYHHPAHKGDGWFEGYYVDGYIVGGFSNLTSDKSELEFWVPIIRDTLTEVEEEKFIYALPEDKFPTKKKYLTLYKDEGVFFFSVYPTEHSNNYRKRFKRSEFENPESLCYRVRNMIKDMDEIPEDEENGVDNNSNNTTDS